MGDQELLAAQRAVLNRYARKVGHGKRAGIQPATCTPGWIEKSDAARHGSRPGSVGKVIFDDVDSAEAAARELETLYGTPFRTYECHRSKHGHRHLTTARAQRA